MKKVPIIVTAILFLSSILGVMRLSFADTIEYQDKDEYIVLTNLVDVQQKEDHYSFVDVSKGYARQQTLSINGNKKSGHRVIPSSTGQIRTYIQTHMSKMWNGSVTTSSGKRIDLLGMRLSYMEFQSGQLEKESHLFKEKSACITDENNIPIEFDIKRINEIQFLKSATEAEIRTTDKSVVRISFPCSQDYSNYGDYQLTGVSADTLRYVTLSISTISTIVTDRKNQSLLASISSR
jgi:hypothetical protein